MSDVLAGVAIVPFLLILGSVFSDDLMREAMTDKVIVAIGGFIGLVCVLAELLRANDLPTAAHSKAPDASGSAP
jgi:hypothetical protein